MDKPITIAMSATMSASSAKSVWLNFASFCNLFAGDYNGMWVNG